MLREIAFILVVLVALPHGAQALVVDHSDVDRVQALSQQVMDAVGRQTWFFSHASVGSNMISGMNALHSANPTRYKLTVTSVSYNSAQLRAYDPPSPTADGRIYECPRGNPGWSSKITIFDNSVRTSGWHHPTVDAAMDKFCYIDQTANSTTYVNTMAALEASYPATRFVYMTMPLMTSSDSNNVLRNQYNAAVRSYCLANNKLLFDIADMEAYDPSGVQYTFTYGGQTYQKLYSGYTSDGGHLNTAGQERIALGWYAVAAAMVPYGITNRDSADPGAAVAAANFSFAVWGTVATIDADSFWVSDGSASRIKIEATGYSGLSDGDYVRATGFLDTSTNPPILISSSGRITKLN